MVLSVGTRVPLICGVQANPGGARFWLKDEEMNRLDEKVGIGTGGARGIGRAICLLFAREGARVAVTDIIDEEGKQVTDHIKEQGGTAQFWSLDTSNEEQVRRVVGDFHQRFGSSHVLVNNARISGSNQRRPMKSLKMTGTR
jgi:NAD(P)-dependent dehydrogenase (short-subunit alcohol dehydrogenase family)